MNAGWFSEEQLRGTHNEVNSHVVIKRIKKEANEDYHSHFASLTP